MAKVFKSVEIDAPVEKVYGYMTDPNNLPEIWPSMVAVSNVKTEAGGTHSFHWKYKMAGMIFEGDSSTEEVVPNQRVVTKNTGGIPSRFVWTYQAEGSRTKLSMEAEYTVPTPLIGKLAEPFIAKVNEREAEAVMANLKARMET